MNFKRILPAMAFAGLFTFASCLSPQEKAMTELEALTEIVKSNGKDFNAEEWERVSEKYAEIKESLKDVELTDEELKALGEAEGELTKACLKEGAKSVGKGLENTLNKVGSYIEGFTKGVDKQDKE